MYFIYSLLTAAGMIFLLPYFLLRGLASGKYLHNFRQRMGAMPADFYELPTEGPGAIWLHCVSVGEVLAGVPLARELKKRFPHRAILVSTTTETGQQVARRRMDAARSGSDSKAAVSFSRNSAGRPASPSWTRTYSR